MNKDETGLVMKYFVLNPSKDTPYGRASRVALIAYAEEIKKTNPMLSKDILDWIEPMSTMDFISHK